MNEEKKKKWKKPELKKLKIIDDKININGNLYSIEEILNDDELDHYYHSHPELSSKEIHHHLK